jgi:hypothetical protein
VVCKTLEADTSLVLNSAILSPEVGGGQPSVAQTQSLSSFEVVLSVPLGLLELPNNYF